MVAIKKSEKILLFSKLQFCEEKYMVTKINDDKCELIQNLDKLHTTELGFDRVKKNLFLDVDDVVKWCMDKILKSNAIIVRRGKNCKF